MRTGTTNPLIAKLDQLEASLQTLIERNLSRLVPVETEQRDLAHRLVTAMYENAQLPEDGHPLAPNLFVLLANPGEAEALSENQRLLEELAGALDNAGREAGFQYAQPPTIQVIASEEQSPRQIEIIARVSQPYLGETVSIEQSGQEPNPAIPPNAFLIVNNDEIFPLTLPVVNIGRRSNNHLAIHDPRVSRQHAQLRANQGLYIIFDLKSTGGTFINKKRITQAVLRPGDVISLAGFPLVYGQEYPKSMTSTRELPPLE